MGKGAGQGGKGKGGKGKGKGKGRQGAGQQTIHERLLPPCNQHSKQEAILPQDVSGAGVKFLVMEDTRVPGARVPRCAAAKTAVYCFTGCSRRCWICRQQKP